MTTNTNDNEPTLDDTSRLDWILSNCEIRNGFVNIPDRKYTRDDIDCLLMAEHLYNLKKNQQKEQEVLDKVLKDI